MRGPGVVPRVPGRPETRTHRQRFNDLAIDIITEIDDRWAEHLGLVEYGVEDTPMLPDDWPSLEVPMAATVHGKGARPTRLVLFRRPIERRCESRTELEAMILMVVVEQIAALLNIEPERVDPRYERE